MIDISLGGEDVLKKIKKGNPFLITVSLFDKKEKTAKDVETFLLVNDFPRGKLDKTAKMIAKMISDAKKENK